MDKNVVIFIVFLVLLVELISIALSLFMAREKGMETWHGVIWGLLPIIGQLIIAFIPVSDLNLVNTLYKRDLISKDDYNKTVEINNLDKLNINKKFKKNKTAK